MTAQLHGRQVRVDLILPPVPTNRWDWSAVWTDYEPGDPIGYGATPEQALRDLREQVEMMEAA